MAIISGLTGGVNGIVFGGGIGRDESLASVLKVVERNSTGFQESIEVETSRLIKEREEARKRDTNLEAQNQKSKEKTIARHSAQEQVQKSYDEYKDNFEKKEAELKQKQEEIQAELNKEIQEKISELHKNFQEFQAKTKQQVEEQTKKIEEILKSMKESNEKLIKEVEKQILNLPNKIFEESEIKAG